MKGRSLYCIFLIFKCDWQEIKEAWNLDTPLQALAMPLWK
jgi:hypothetical protein